jgi:hypothetical protein
MLELVTREVPSPEEARRLWKEGKSLKEWQNDRKEEQRLAKKAIRKQKE